jgi:hypothetical protein
MENTPQPIPAHPQPADEQAAHDGTPGEQKTASGLDDPRYASGDVFDLKDEQTGL